jgi:signal recognition particle receptor subunit beta
MRTVWKYYYPSVEGIIFVLDSSNVDRIHEARDELLKLLANDEARTIPVLIFANKQDLPGSVKSQELVDMLGVTDYVNKKPIALVRVQESSAVHDQGLLDGFEWIVDKIITLNLARSQ